MPRQRVTAFLGAIVGLALLGPWSATGAVAATQAMVIGTDALNVRSCPSLACDVVAVVRLGEPLTVTGATINGFVPVIAGGKAGYAYDLFVAAHGGGVPTLIEGAAGCNRVALIFNVGIGETPDIGILDTLKREGTPATIFVMGWWAAANPGLVAQMMADGFVIGSHGDQPLELTTRTDAEVVADVRAAAEAILNAAGAPPGPWFTPYAAAVDDRVRALVASLGYLPVGWTVPAADYGPEATAEEVYRRVVTNVYDGAIVELHLDAATSAVSTGAALPRIITDLRRQGYRLVTIPEMAEPCA